MTCSEREACERWCPFVRGAWASPSADAGWRMNGSPVGFNRAWIRPGTEEVSLGLCIGSDCMAWRTSGAERTRREVRLIGLERKQVTAVIERRGYCGLAGAPSLPDEEVPA